MESKPITLSYSGASTFKACPEKYYLSKEYKTILRPATFPFGNALESAITVLLKDGTLPQAYLKFKQDWKVEPANRWQKKQIVFDSLDIFYYQSAFDKQLLRAVDLRLCQEWFNELIDPNERPDILKVMEVLLSQVKNKEAMEESERLFYHRVLWMCDRRRGMLMIRAFYEKILPDIIEVIAIQKPISISNADGDRIMGFLDFILKVKGIDGPVLFDLKASGILYEAHHLQTSDQLRTYAAAENIRHIGYLVLFKKVSYTKFCNKCGHKRPKGNKKKCEECEDGKYEVVSPTIITQNLTRKLDEKELDDILNDFTDIAMAIKNKIRWKNSNACFNFGTRCEYYDVCWDGKDPKELSNLEPKRRKS